MKTIRISLHVLTLISCASYAFADSAPPRRPGLWGIETTIIGQSNSKNHTSSLSQCSSHASDRMLESKDKMNQEYNKCSQYQLTRISGGYSVSSVCEHPEGSTISSEGLFKGDFNSKYSGEVTTTIAPPLHGRSLLRVWITAMWLGDCPPGMRPGDTVRLNGNVASGTTGKKPATSR